MTSLHDLPRTKLVYCNQTLSYEVVITNPESYQLVLEYARLGIRSAILIFITILVIVIGWKFKQMELKKKSITRYYSISSADRVLSSAQLLSLTLIQSVTLIICYSPLLFWYIIIYILLPVNIDIFGESLDYYRLFVTAVVIVAPGCNFIFYMLLSKSFLNAARSLLTGYLGQILF